MSTSQASETDWRPAWWVEDGRIGEGFFDLPHDQYGHVWRYPMWPPGTWAWQIYGPGDSYVMTKNARSRNKAIEAMLAFASQGSPT